MTLVVAVGTPDAVVQVSDRRLTTIAPGGARSPHPEEETKSTVWTLPAGRFAVGYTGIARLGRKPMEEALCEDLAAAATEGGYVPRPAVDALAGLLTRRLLTNPDRRSARLSVMITGHVRQEHGPELVQALLSNYQDWGRGDADVAAPHMVTTYFSTRRGAAWPTLVQRIGDYRLITDQRAGELRALLLPNRPASAIVGLLIDRWPLWTEGADAVGATLNSLVLPADPALDPLWRFHSETVSGRWVAGNTVTCSPTESLSVRGLTLTVEEDGPPLSVPAVPKRHRCPCGSGRMYGRCHRQR